MAKSIYRKENVALIEVIRDARISAGLTQAQVSEGLGRSQLFISDVELGKRRLDVIELRDIAHLCGISLAKLIGRFERSLQRKPA